LPLNAEVTLLPTPNASDGSGGGQHPDKREGHSRQLIDYVLLCTPSASDGAGGKTSRSGGRINEPLLGGQAREMATAWGKYAPAIARWEALTRPAPPPTEPNKNGNPRLAAAFSEWLMGWPDGWVTNPDIGISRSDQLRIVGNGVCPQQASAALRYLLAICEAVA
jgi:DNA (cytosine-5)-methyltransferase 1